MTDPDADLEDKAAPPPPDDGSIRASISRLIASGKELAEAEIAAARIKAALVADVLRKSLVLTSLALVFLVLGVVILTSSAILALIPLVGPVLASLIVAGVCIALAAIFAILARQTFKSMFDNDEAEEEEKRP